MAKIFAYKKQKRIFALLVVLFLLIVGYSIRASIFEKEWYNLEYGNYKKSPDSWVVTEAKIKDTKTYNGSNDSALTLLDLYQTAIVDVETADGRTLTFRTSRKSSEKIGDRIRVCYDARYDTGWSPAVEGEGPPEVIPRSEPTENHFFSGMAKILAVLTAACAAGYAFICYKKSDQN